MSRLTDLIVKAKNGKPVKDMLGLEEKEQGSLSRLQTDELIDQITLLEAMFFKQSDDVKAAHLKSVIVELEQIIGDL